MRVAEVSLVGDSRLTIPEEARAFVGVRVDMDYGDPRLPDRFWAKVYPEPNTGCWLWGASSVAGGYGSIQGPARRKVVAHRWLFAAGLGEWPPAHLDIDHLCRVTACVNPDHIELVPRQVNILRGNIGQPRTVCPQGHVMDEANTYYSRSRNKLGHRARRRHCHTCMKDRSREWGRRNQAEYRRRRLAYVPRETPEQRSEHARRAAKALWAKRAAELRGGAK